MADRVFLQAYNQLIPTDAALEPSVNSVLEE